MPVGPDTFRDFFGSCPAAVSVVTVRDADGEPRGFTCNTVCSVSVTPPLLLVCVDKKSQTLPSLEPGRGFVVNVLADGGQETAKTFATRTSRKFDAVSWHPSAAALGAPVLSDVALAHAECVVTSVIEAGDHWIVLGRVEEARVLPRRPVLYHRGAFTPWEGPVSVGR
ncbi:flavin reductase family protein [Streptomyces sp. NPDC020379]|uniref:flavin reductase family protein n=1 Tax=Streptomyces sp. NPDC020379 TaxID=3365071 RepID=UPI00379783A2